MNIIKKYNNIKLKKIIVVYDKKYKAIEDITTLKRVLCMYNNADRYMYRDHKTYKRFFIKNIKNKRFTYKLLKCFLYPFRMLFCSIIYISINLFSHNFSNYNNIFTIISIIYFISNFINLFILFKIERKFF